MKMHGQQKALAVGHTVLLSTLLCCEHTWWEAVYQQKNAKIWLKLLIVGIIKKVSLPDFPIVHKEEQ